MSMISQAFQFAGDVLGRVALVIGLFRSGYCQAEGRSKS